MGSFERLIISRRAVLRGGLAAGGYLLISEQPASSVVRPASGERWRPLAERLTLATAKYFSPDWGSELSASLPVRYVLPTGGRDTALNAQWDERLFAVGDTAFGIAGEITRELALARPSPHSMNIQIPAGVGEVILRVEALNPYPAENLPDVRASSFQLRDRRGTVREEWVDSPAATECTPWSLEAAVNWICHEGDVVPGRVSVTSAGPFAIPAGVAIRLTYADVLGAPRIVDPVAAPDDSSASLPTTLESTVLDGYRELTLKTTQAVSPGTQLELLFDIDVSDSKPRPFDAYVPRLTLLPPTKQIGMRLSDRHSSFPVTSSGSQLSSYVAAPTA